MTRPGELDRVLTCYRIGDPNGKYPIFDASGSRQYPGRWNTTRAPVIYASEHYSTAMLEKLVHANGHLPPNQHFLTITISAGLSYEVVTRDSLPSWDTLVPGVSRTYGETWTLQQRTLLLLVPSYVARIERNIIINPDHPEFDQVQYSLPEPVWWDERLF